MKEKFVRFMQGRYGVDQLNRFLMIFAVVLMVFSAFGADLCYLLAILVMVYAYYRMFSKQIYKRSVENQKYLQYQWKVKACLAKHKSELQQRKTHHIYKCPNCKQKIRVPKGRGRIAITCRKCQHEFVKRS